MSIAVDMSKAVEVESLDGQKMRRLIQLWHWLVTDQLCCDTCASELATFGVEKELGDGKFVPVDKRCAKRRGQLEGTRPSCMDRMRGAPWAGRPAL